MNRNGRRQRLGEEEKDEEVALAESIDYGEQGEDRQTIPRSQLVLVKYFIVLVVLTIILWILLLENHGTHKGDEQYLLILPWEQMNNQLLCIISGCAVANMTGRILVIPDVGYKREGVLAGYDIKDFEFQPFETYFDLDALAKKIPCKYILTSKFLYKVGDERVIDLLIWHDNYLKSSLEENVDYFEGIHNIKIKKTKMMKMMTQHSKRDIMEVYSNMKEKYLATGSMFMFYSFEIRQPFPITRNYNYMSHPNYASAREAIQPIKSLRETANGIVKTELGPEFVAIHYRLGDYVQKCQKIVRINPSLKKSCIPLIEEVESAIDVALKKTNDSFINQLFIATNMPDQMEEIKSHLKGRFERVVTLEDVFFDHSVLSPVEKILLDQLLCTEANVFVGNIYSSFTRTISDWRSLSGRKNDYF